MKHTICFIDDKIPIAQYGEYFNETDIINESVIRFLLKQKDADWQDLTIRMLCERLLSDGENWSTSAFTNPTFYTTYCSNTVYAPEVIVYDWDYPSLPDAPENVLEKILNETYALIFIFSEEENIDGINEVLAQDAFIPFKDRLMVIAKGKKDSVDSIFAKIQETESKNFSFAYGGQIVHKSNQIINAILSDISKLSIETFIATIGEEDNNGRYYFATTNNFVDVIIPRYRNALCSILFNNSNILKIDKTQDANINAIKKVWSYRMYEHNDSNIVSMGDIIKSKLGDNYYIVISSDCHMQDFWHKNGGYIALVPIEKLIQGERNTQAHLIGEGKAKITSLINSQRALTAIPAVPIEGQLIDFVVLPKQLKTSKITRPEDNPSILTYDVLSDYDKIVSIVDPFKSPLFHFIMNRISDLGCPDYHEKIKENLTNLIK